MKEIPIKKALPEYHLKRVVFEGRNIPGVLIIESDRSYILSNDGGHNETNGHPKLDYKEQEEFKYSFVIEVKPEGPYWLELFSVRLIINDPIEIW